MNSFADRCAALETELAQASQDAAAARAEMEAGVRRMNALQASWQATEEGKYFTSHASLRRTVNCGSFLCLPPPLISLSLSLSYTELRTDLERVSAQLSEERERLNQRVLALENELVRSQEAEAATVDGRIRELAEAQGQYDALAKQLAALSQDKAALHQQLKTATATVKGAELQNTALKNSMESLEGSDETVEILLKEKASVQLKLDAVLERMRDLKEENAALKASVASLEGAAVAVEALRVELRQQHDLALATEAAALEAKTEVAEYIRTESERTSTEARASRFESGAREDKLTKEVGQVTLHP